MNLTAVAYFFGGFSKIPRGEGHFPHDSNLQKMADVCAVQSADVPRKLVRSEKAFNIALGICLRCCFPGPGLGFLVDPFGGAKPRLKRRGKEVPLRVNPEPSTRGQAEGQAQALRRGVEGLTILARASLLMNAEKDGAGLAVFGTVFYREKE